MGLMGFQTVVCEYLRVRVRIRATGSGLAHMHCPRGKPGFVTTVGLLWFVAVSGAGTEVRLKRERDTDSSSSCVHGVYALTTKVVGHIHIHSEDDLPVVFVAFHRSVCFNHLFKWKNPIDNLQCIIIRT